MPTENKTSLCPTTWQTVGPFFSIGLEPLYVDNIAVEGVVGERVSIEGQILDGDGQPIPDCLVEIWQANANGKYAHPEDFQTKPLEENFRGFARLGTDDQGRFGLVTIKPGTVEGPNGLEQAPHLVVSLTMRGLLRGLATRAYFEGDSRNSTDPILQLVPQDRRGTLMMKSSSAEPTRFLWTIRMQHPTQETVFFDF
jgi:protocatechuate 3,4-dioxygenase, alpha subunit